MSVTIFLIGFVLLVLSIPIFFTILAEGEPGAAFLSLVFTAIPGAALWMWLWVAHSAAIQPKKEVELPIVTRNGAQCAVVERDNATEYINLNRKYAKVIDGEKAYQTTYEGVWSKGIYVEACEEITLR